MIGSVSRQPVRPEASSVDLGRLLVGRPELAGAWGQRRLAVGEVLFEEGDPADALYVVAEGALDVIKRETPGQAMVLERLGPGDCFGEVALLDGSARGAGVVAVEPTRLNMLGREDFLEHVWRSPDLAEAAVSLMSTRMRRSNQYLGYLTSWSRLVAEGRYDAAESAMATEALQQEDPNVAVFLQTFRDMVDSVSAREAALEQALEALRIEIDQTKHARQVAAIADSDFFQDLQERAGALRRRRKEGSQDQ